MQAPFGDRACLRDFTARLTAFGSVVAYVTIDYQEALTPGPDGLAGCTRVHQEALQFPAHLCAGLPAVGPYSRNQG